MKILRKCKTWQSDGIFDTVPLLFKQLYSIHGRKDDIIMPLVYVLCTHKSKQTYKFILDSLIELKPDSKPSLLIVDFELAFINAFKETFPDAEIHGSFFHFCQCVWRHIQEFGLQKKYHDDAVFSLKIRKLLALAFVPVCDVLEHYDALINSEYYIQNEDILELLLDYFEPTWIINKRRRRKNSPTYSIELWNCYRAVLDKSPRTNNSTEAWHRGFSDKLNVSHASMWKFFNAIQLEQSLTENKYSDLTGGKVQQTRKRKAIEFVSNLLNLVVKYKNNENHDELEFLQGIVMNTLFFNETK